MVSTTVPGPPEPIDQSRLSTGNATIPGQSSLFRVDPRFTASPPLLSRRGNRLDVTVKGDTLSLTNLDKVFWPEEGYRKGELIEYYAKIAPYLLPHLEGYPLVLVRYPDGIKGKFFYQKEAPEFRPEWLPTVDIPSEGKRTVIRYCMVKEERDLFWLINLGCIEVHPWLSKINALNNPTAMVFDLDPHESQSFQTVVEVAQLVKSALDSFGLTSYPKTSGASGIHVYVPVKPVYDYQTVRECAVFIAKFIEKADNRVTLTRQIKDRGTRLYLDCWQIARGKTLAGVYSLRPVEKAPVSTPLYWEEIDGTLSPNKFTMKNIFDRLREKGDLFLPVLTKPNDLSDLLPYVQKTKSHS
ncbi:DNA polymerase domain-containing protein [Heliobacillus mobilis]|uniref:DNA polymerase domain-containing protein n=1 Tax=Heliobacterium mobile TaxID=28064 RepID=A0A6I3SMZ1_HELMO|nr:DNA polymerase domain-containing protein [Heliobacterium mobile]